jgi:competence protein ComEC
MRFSSFVCCAVCIFAGAIGQQIIFAAEPTGLRIIWVDVEGGAATLLVTPQGESMLIDAGNPGFRDADRITKAAAAAGVKKIDHFVNTHYHSDHFGGAAALAKVMPIGIVHDNGEWPAMVEKPDRTYREFACDKRLQLMPGKDLELLKKPAEGELGVRIHCIGTRQEFEPVVESAADNPDCGSAKPKDRDGSDNANSVVLLIEYGPFRFFDAGDLTWNVEKNVVCPKNRVGKVDVYQVTHHGLDASNNPLVVRALEPTVAIMNNGTTKGCAPEVFETLSTTKSVAAIYQVHKNLRPDGAKNNAPDEFIANKEKECAANSIHLEVSVDGKSYWVSIPAHGHKKEYKTRGNE